jgi:hypothetical protein
MPKFSFDPDAQAFITAAAITDNTQKNAINTLVLDLKAYSIWTKFKAIYPIVGGTASQHKFNLKDPRDLDVAFRLNFTTGWTHSANGMLPNGTSAFANTFLVPSSNFNTSTFNHLSYYSRSNTAKIAEYVMGTFNGIGNHGMIIRRNDNSSIFIADYATSINFRSAGGIGVTDGRGLFLGSQTGSNVKMYRNGSAIYANTNATLNNAIPNTNIYIGALFIAAQNLYTDKQCAFASIGDGLTDTEAANFYTAVQAFQTSLSRNV